MVVAQHVDEYCPFSVSEVTCIVHSFDNVLNRLVLLYHFGNHILVKHGAVNVNSERNPNRPGFNKRQISLHSSVSLSVVTAGLIEYRSPQNGQKCAVIQGFPGFA